MIITCILLAISIFCSRRGSGRNKDCSEQKKDDKRNESKFKSGGTLAVS